MKEIITPILKMRKQRLREYLARGHKAKVTAGIPAHLPKLFPALSRQNPHLGEAGSSPFQAKGSLNSFLKICLACGLMTQLLLR